MEFLFVGGPKDGEKVVLDKLQLALHVAEFPKGKVRDVYDAAIDPHYQSCTKSAYHVKYLEIEMLDVVWRYIVYVHESLNPHQNLLDLPDVRRTHVLRVPSPLKATQLRERDREFNEARAYGWIDFCIRTGRRPALETFTNAVAHTVKGLEKELRCKHLLTMEPN